MRRTLHGSEPNCECHWADGSHAYTRTLDAVVRGVQAALGEAAVVGPGNFARTDYDFVDYVVEHMTNANTARDPTPVPTTLPSFAPTTPSVPPSQAPSYTPTAAPTPGPSLYAPTAPPTLPPSALPSPAPTYAPSATPSVPPTSAPTSAAPRFGGGVPRGDSSNACAFCFNEEGWTRWA